VALNNAVGEPRFNRADMAKFQPAFDDRDMPVKFLVRAISVGKSPYEGVVCKKLTGTYKVFLETSGIYVVCVTLFLKNGTQQSHMISFDANRDILCFGMDDAGFEQITLLIEKPDRSNEAAARDNLLGHFPDLKRIEVTFVIEMRVKVKALKNTHEPAYTVVSQKRKGVSGSEGESDSEIEDIVDDMEIAPDDGKCVFPKGTRGSRGGGGKRRKQLQKDKKRDKANKCEP
jgi:hypothetical protein